MSITLKNTDKLALIQVDFTHTLIGKGIKVMSSYEVSVKRNLSIHLEHGGFHCQGRFGFEEELGEFQADPHHGNRFAFVIDSDSQVESVVNKAQQDAQRIIESDKKLFNGALHQLQSLTSSVVVL